MDSINRKQLVLLGIAALFVLLVVEAAVPPPSQEVHTIGGTPVKAAAYTTSNGSNARFQWQTGPATESLSEIKCNHFGANDASCGATDIAELFPTLKQDQSTLYYVWSGCVDWSGAGPVISWHGFNIEYFASNRTLVLHCYVGTGLLYFPDRLFGTAGIRSNTLLAIPTSGMGGGQLHISEDDRLEHLVGYSSTEYELTTATIP